MKINLALLAVTALLAPACAPSRCPEAPAARMEATPPASATPSAPPAAAPGPRVAITLHPAPGVTSVEVEVRASGDAGALSTFSFSPPGGVAALHVNSVRDDQGAMEAQPALRDGRVVLALPRRASGEVRVVYGIDASSRRGAVPGVEPDATRFQASGEPLLLLPDGLDDHAVHATITILIDRYVVDDGQKSLVGAGSSFGVGAAREVDVRGRDLRAGVYVAGAMGHAIFEAYEGHDEAGWFGYTAFDPRPIAADVAAFRTGARDVFRVPEETPLTLLILADGRVPGAFAAARRARSVLVRVGTGEPWTGPVRIAVAAEVLHAWIGERLWIGPSDPAHEAEAYWFTEGFARHLARDMSFRFGLLTPRELLDEVHGLAGLVATSPRRSEGNAELAAHAKEPGAVPLLVARGALYATSIGARIRAKNKGKRMLDDVLRALLLKARDTRGPLSTAAWIEAVSAELGAGEPALFTKAIGEGKAGDLPDDALGPCFRKAARSYEAFDLGFDDDATRAATDRKIVGLRAGGPAERAGLHAGDALVDAVIGRGRSDVPVTLTVERGGEKKTIKYLPAGARAKGTGFVRKQDVPDEACAK